MFQFMVSLHVVLFFFFKIIDTDGLLSVSNRVHDKPEHILYAIE